MTGRSYAQIRWQKSKLGLLMVNPSREKFFIHAEKLVWMFNHRDEFLVVKERDRVLSRAVGYYPGMVMGTLDHQDTSYRVTLYIGEPYRDIGYNKETSQLTHFMHTMEYLFPCDELTKYHEVISIMTSQQATFEESLDEAEATPRVQYIRPKRKTVQAS